MLTCVIQIQMHLSRIRMCEFTKFKINDDETSEPSVEEHQVDPVPLVSAERVNDFETPVVLRLESDVV
jgi:hypothetical protein